VATDSQTLTVPKQDKHYSIMKFHKANWLFWLVTYSLGLNQVLPLKKRYLAQLHYLRWNFEIIGNIYRCVQVFLFVHIVHMIKLNFRIFVAFCTTTMMFCSGEQVFVYGNFMKFSFFHRYITVHWMLNGIPIIYTSYVMETFYKIKYFKFLQDMGIRIFIYRVTLAA
jgi:hypothetical protein